MHNSVIIKSAALKRPQRLHAWGITLIPFLGTLLAIAYASVYGVSALDIGLLILFYSLTILGISVGFHRLFAHRAFATYPAIRAVWAILGSMACQGPVIYWVSNHRRHHQFSDVAGDPHSPYCDGDRPLKGFSGFWHAHVGWTFSHDATNPAAVSKDLIRDPLISAINRHYYRWVALSVMLPFFLGGLLTGTWAGALSGFLWGSMVRLFITFHATNSINSITHLFGSRPFATKENSTNNVWLAIPIFGEAWHNNHHAFPYSAIFGFEPWQIDIGGWVIVALEKLGLAWDVRRPTPQQVTDKKLEAASERA